MLHQWLNILPLLRPVILHRIVTKWKRSSDVLLSLHDITNEVHSVEDYYCGKFQVIAIRSSFYRTNIPTHIRTNLSRYRCRRRSTAVPIMTLHQLVVKVWQYRICIIPALIRHMDGQTDRWHWNNSITFCTHSMLTRNKPVCRPKVPVLLWSHGPTWTAYLHRSTHSVWLSVRTHLNHLLWGEPGKCLQSLLILQFLHCALAVAQRIVINPVFVWVCGCVCGSVTNITRNCVHRSSPNWVCRKR